MLMSRDGSPIRHLPQGPVPRPAGLTVMITLVLPHFGQANALSLGQRLDGTNGHPQAPVFAGMSAI